MWLVKSASISRDWLSPSPRGRKRVPLFVFFNSFSPFLLPLRWLEGRRRVGRVFKGSSEWMVTEMGHLAHSWEVWPVGVGRGGCCCSVGAVMLHSGQSFPGTPALPCSTAGTGPGERSTNTSEKVRNVSPHLSCWDFHPPPPTRSTAHFLSPRSFLSCF